jgi:hypothetical protein
MRTEQNQKCALTIPVTAQRSADNNKDRCTALLEEHRDTA